ncbi:potassium channel, sub T, member 2 [Allomyces javanicus]|nr:potassium channel, sub T, member 2 [Allomyces javanicus]
MDTLPPPAANVQAREPAPAHVAATTTTSPATARSTRTMTPPGRTARFTDDIEPITSSSDGADGSFFSHVRRHQSGRHARDSPDHRHRRSVPAPASLDLINDVDVEDSVDSATSSRRQAWFFGRAAESTPELPRHLDGLPNRSRYDRRRLANMHRARHRDDPPSDHGSDSDDDDQSSDSDGGSSSDHSPPWLAQPLKALAGATIRSPKERHDRAALKDLGLSSEFQDMVSVYRRKWHRPWSTVQKERSFGSSSLQSINPARYIYERKRRKERQGSLNDVWVHLRALLTTLHLFLRSKPLRGFAIMLNLVTDAAHIVLYLVEMAAIYPLLGDVPMAGFEPPWLFVPRPEPIWVICYVFSIINLVAFISRITFSQDRYRTLMTLETAVDVLTTIPFLIAKLVENGRMLYVPYFLRSIPFISRVRRFMHIRLELSDTIEQVDAIQGKLVNVIATIVTIIYTTMCAFQYTQVMFDDQALTVIDSLYLTIVTLSTVGFGDITPKSWQGRVVVIVAIAFAFVSVPGMVSSALEAWRAQRDGGGSYVKHTKNQHVVFIGRFDDPGLVTSLLQALFHNEDSKPLQVVFLSRRSPSPAVKALISAPVFHSRVFYIQGSALNPADLGRAKITTADAVFFISNNTTREDERNVLRVWSVVRYAPLTHLYIYTHRPEFERYHMVHATAVVCADEMKQSLLGANCIHRGVATMMINLVSTMTPEDHYDQPWMAQYGDGLGHEIYSMAVPEVFQGKRFHHVAAYMFLEFQIIAIAVRIPILHRSNEFETEDYHVILNPGSEYVLRGNEDIVCIAQGLHEINLVLAMNKEQFDTSLQNHPPIFSTTASKGLPSHFTLRRQPSESSGSSTSNPPVMPPLPSTPYIIGQPDTPFSDNRKIALCHLLRRAPKRVDDVRVDDGMHLTGHMVVITASWHLSRFLCTVRGAHIPAEDLRPILFLSTTLPSPDEFRFLAPFPLVYFMVANPRRRKDLQRANMTAADRVVILPDAESLPVPGDDAVGDDFVDLGPILTRHLVAHVAARTTTNSSLHESIMTSTMPGVRRGHMYTMVELNDANAIKYLDPSADVTGVGGTHHYHLHPLQATPWVDDGSERAPTRVDSPLQDGMHEGETVVSIGLVADVARSSMSVDVMGSSTAAQTRAVATLQRDTRRRLRRRIATQDNVVGNVPGSPGFAMPTIDSAWSTAPRIDKSGANAKPSPSKSSTRTRARSHNAIPPRWQMFYTPQFASGEAFCPNLLDTILVSHYYNPVVLDIVKLFAGIRTRTHLRLDRELRLQPSFLYTIDVPPEYVGRPFKDLFADLCIEYGVVTVGLYRAPSAKLGNDASFVYTAPHPEVVLNASDVMYVLSKVWSSENGTRGPSSMGTAGDVKADDGFMAAAAATNQAA